MTRFGEEIMPITAGSGDNYYSFKTVHVSLKIYNKAFTALQITDVDIWEQTTRNKLKLFDRTVGKMEFGEGTGAATDGCASPS